MNIKLLSKNRMPLLLVILIVGGAGVSGAAPVIINRPPSHNQGPLPAKKYDKASAGAPANTQRVASEGLKKLPSHNQGIFHSGY